MKSKFGTILMVLGTALVLGALSLFLYNEQEAEQAEQAADVLLPQLIEQIKLNQSGSEQELPVILPNGSVESTKAPDTPQDPADTSDSSAADTPADTAATTVPDPYAPPDEEMEEAVVDGYGYIGYITFPTLGIQLPVMGEWDYKRLKIAPCRYTGSVEGDDLVIMAHNYRYHFGPIRRLKVGNKVKFTDVYGNTIVYKVAALDTLAPTAVSKVTSGEYDLTLFTCTYGGQTRVTVFCDRAQ